MNVIKWVTTPKCKECKYFKRKKKHGGCQRKGRCPYPAKT